MNLDISQDAVNFIKANRLKLCEEFASINKYPPVLNPSAYFMAGSPGAGKTEYSKSFIKQLEIKHPARKIVRIDADEIRDWVPQYDHTNSAEIQRAAALGVEKLLDCVLRQDQDFLLDATFALYDKSLQNITRCLHKGRKVGITYIYQDPKVAWDFTKKRETLEGRRVPKHTFIDAFFKAKENVDRIKQELGSNIELELIIKNVEQKTEKSYFNIERVDNYLKISYTPQSLEEILI